MTCHLSNAGAPDGGTHKLVTGLVYSCQTNTSLEPRGIAFLYLHFQTQCAFCQTNKCVFNRNIFLCVQSRGSLKTVKLLNVLRFFFMVGVGAVQPYLTLNK